MAQSTYINSFRLNSARQNLASAAACRGGSDLSASGMFSGALSLDFSNVSINARESVFSSDVGARPKASFHAFSIHAARYPASRVEGMTAGPTTPPPFASDSLYCQPVGVGFAANE